jgi:hypothetical protein
MSKKGQAAMEFLMTYGWAILAAIIAIGVLAYFGAFNPGKLAGNQGIINTPFNLDAFKIEAATDTIIMEVTQNIGSSINLFSDPAAGFYVDLVSPTAGTCNVAVSAGDPVLTTDQWTSGSKVTFTASSCGTADWADEDQVKGDIKIIYTTSGSALAQQSTGTVRGNSQAA